MTPAEVKVQHDARVLLSDITSILTWTDPVTERNIAKHGGVWSINDQIAQITEETGETRHAWRKEGLLRTVEENVDIIISAIVNLRIVQLNREITEQEFLNVLDSASHIVTRKLYERVGIIPKS